MSDNIVTRWWMGYFKIQSDVYLITFLAYSLFSALPIVYPIANIMMLTRTIIALSFVVYALSAPPQKRQFEILNSLFGGGGGGGGGGGLSSLTGKLPAVPVV
ncbi:hypothetical protein EDB92DRAFT_2113950 [Lactarius akahatsu]|uniref:Uncharacterized protein n=1 Tax=Lactarius akahatsu TaxID=416441 RepID=A0AAD4LIN9_9AGAM|nr:hypothetical protein EDB92DRAFT_2113950 [Lactarius akahatsu]